MSPYNLIQEQVVTQPEPVWRMLIACALLNRVNGLQTRTLVDEVFRRWSTPDEMAAADPIEIAHLLKPLGLQNRRAVALRAISGAYLQRVPLKDMPYVGDYGLASINIVFLKKLDYPTDDPWLIKYRDWARAKVNPGRINGHHSVRPS